VTNTARDSYPRTEREIIYYLSYENTQVKLVLKIPMGGLRQLTTHYYLSLLLLTSLDIITRVTELVSTKKHSNGASSSELSINFTILSATSEY
jgi:hypothetical protein